MRKLLNILTIALTYAICSSAQSQVATVTSTAQFELRGANVTPGQGVPSWPVMPDDTITAGSGSVTITFHDGSTLILDPKSTAKVAMSGQTPEFQLQTGSAHYALKSTSGVKLVAMGKAVSPTRLSGFVKISNGHVSTGWWSPAHTAVVVGGVAAASAAGVAAAEATKGGSSVSSSH